MDRRRVIPIFVIVLVNFFGGTIVAPALPLYALRHFGAPESVVPLLMASYFAAQFVAAPLLGRLSDKYGRIPVLIISQIGTVISFIIMAFAGDLTILFLARILDGATGGNVIVAQAYMTDITPRQHRTRALGLIFAAFGIGYTFGPAVGGVLTVFGDNVPFFVGAVVSFIPVVMTWFMLDESLTAEERLARRQRNVQLAPRLILSNVSLLLVLAIAFAAQFSMSLMQSTFPLFGEKVIFARNDPNTVGLGVGILLGMIGVAQVITQGALIKPVIARFGERRTVILGAALRALGLLTLVIFTSPFLIGPVSLVAFAAGSGLMMPPLQSLTTTCVSEDVCGGVLGVYNSVSSLGIIIGSALSGMMFAAAPTLPYAIGGTILALTIFPAVLLLRQEREVVAVAA